MPESKVKLPPFVIDSELSRSLRQYLPKYLSIANERIIFDWSDVCFFDDYTLIKLIFIQRQLRIFGNRVSNRGFSLAKSDPNKQAVLRQLWTVGLPELTASDHLLRDEQLKDALKDEAILLESDPLYGISAPKAMTAVIPMLCCHNRKHFAAGSREEKQLDSFIRSCLHPSGSKSWDLVESREFRHQMLQQLRRNVHEHSRRDAHNAIGLAIVRIWTSGSLSDEWQLTEKMKENLMRIWDQEPVPLRINKLDDDRGLLQISVVDNGVGIPYGLAAVHEGLLYQASQDDLFPDNKRLHYKDVELDRRFEDPASWSDNKARLIAFAMDQLGTSKPDRAPEIKGLEYLRERAVINMGGAARIESDGVALSHISHSLHYGQPSQIHLTWCLTAGTGICLAVPMTLVESRGDSRKIMSSPWEFGASSGTASDKNRIKVKEHLARRPKINDSYMQADLIACGKEIVDVIRMPQDEENIGELRRHGLLIIDWGELRDSKRVFHSILVEIAEGLSVIDSRQMRPFVFVNLPKGLCGLIGKALNKYSKDTPTPICVFTAEHHEPFWLGLDSEKLISEELRKKVSCELRRKLTDQRENRTEAFLRDCLTQMLANRKALPVALYDSSILRSVLRENYAAVRKSQLFSRLSVLVKRCSLFREEEGRSSDGEKAYTGRFQSVFSMRQIEDEVRSLFLYEFRDIFIKPPVCFTPESNKEGIQLPHSKRVVEHYFRSDALVDSPIAMELSEALTAIALGISQQVRGGSIDWVISCTSPPHWFVHRIVDGLAENGIQCSHYVFPSYEDISLSIESINMRPSETVLVFTDVIASGQTAYLMASSLTNHFGVKIAGLIALADIRTDEDRKHGPDLDSVYNETIICLYNKAEPNREDLSPAYIVDPETVVPKKNIHRDPMVEFFKTNYAGVGSLIQEHGYFSIAERTLDLMTSLEAVCFGHYQHGSHHSEVFIDVEKILSCVEYRNLMVTALFRYIITHDIRLVLYPSHSSAYMLADDLRQRFMLGDSAVEFVMACRTYRGRGTQGTSYALTRFSPHPDPLHWDKFAGHSVLILDDAVCSGATVKSIMAELVRIDRNYYSNPITSSPNTASRFSVHVVAFLNRLPRVTGDFWGGLSRVTMDRVQFSAFISMPLTADSEELCPQCRQRKELEHDRDAKKYCLYAKEFLSWWILRDEVVSYHERRQFANRQNPRFTSAEALRLAGYLSAIERRGYKDIMKNLFDLPGKPADEKSKAVRIHIRSRAGFLYGLLPSSGKSMDMVGDLCRELGSLIDMTLDGNGNLLSQENVLEILQFLMERCLRMRPIRDEVEGIDEVGDVMKCLLTKLVKAFDNRLVVGGLASILDSYLNWFATPNYTENERRTIRDSVKRKVSKIERAGLTEKAALMLDWFETYLTEGGEEIDSVGKAVKMLAEFAKKGRRNHFYGRHELDELRDDFRRPPGEAMADATETIQRTLICADRFLELVKATRVLQSASLMKEEELKDLQNATEQDIQRWRNGCTDLLKGAAADALKSYTEVKSLYLRSYDRWFPTGETAKPKAVEVIGYFTPNLYNAIVSAWESYVPQRLAKEAINMDMTNLRNYDTMKVLIDPTVLTTAMHQLLDNVDKLAKEEEPVKIRCQINLPDSQSKDAQSDDNIEAGLVEIVVSNTDTMRPNLAHLKLRGLSSARMKLSEYGGGLNYNVPEADWTFEVVMKLTVWTEEEK